MRKRTDTPPVSRKAHPTEQAASSSNLAGVAATRPPDTSSGESSRPSSPFAALSLRRTRFSSVPLVELKHADTEEITFPASVELPRRHVTFYSDVDSDSSLSGGGLCSMSDTMESFKDVGGSPSHPSVRIKHLTRNSDGTSRFPKLDECAHFHYDNVELGPVEVVLVEGEDRADLKGPADGDWWFCVQVTSNCKSWQVRRSLDNFQMLDRQLHRCVYDRKFSLLKEITVQPQEPEDALRTMLTQYLERFSQLAGSLINCGPVLNWLELDNRGNRLIVTDEAAINTPAVAAAYVTKRYASQATDEISLEVGDIISVIDMPPPEESSWWRGKKGFQVGFFPCECVEIIGDKVPQSIKIPKAPSKPVLRKHGKLIAFFRSFLLSRPSRRKLKQSGILKERVFGCDLGEHLMNTGRDIPLVLKCCTEFIEQHGIVDGIYRLSGVTSNIQKLRLAFDEDRVPNLMDEAIIQDIHCVASLLKMYFRELPNPLLTFHLYDKFVNAVQADEDLRLLKLRDVVQQLPPPHYRSLEYLMRHLSKVAAYGFQTGMTPKNVAIVWAPNLLRSRDIENGGVGALHVVGVQAVLTEYLIRYTDIIFSEKMPIFPTISMGEETPKKTRPKSLAISTPTKLLSLEEARSRALTSNLLGEHQKFIDVGGGEEGLPIKYHTVIELPARRRTVGKSKKSPSGWRSFFSRGWHTTSGRRKNRRPRSEAERPKIGSPIFSEHSPLVLQDKAVTESDVSHTNTKKLRTVKSAESLFPLSICSSQKANNDQDFSPEDEQPSSLPCYNFTVSAGRHSPVSPKTISCYQKHIRSSSHDSYFERNLEYLAEDDLEPEESIHENINTKRTISNKPDIESKMDTSVEDKFPNEHMTPTRKIAQKQKLVSFESDASSPKMQKISLKRLYHTLSSPPMMKKKDSSKTSDISNAEKQSLLLNDSLQADDGLRRCYILPRNKSEEAVKVGNFVEFSQSQKNAMMSVPSHESATHTSYKTSLGDTCSVKDTISVEVHKTVSDSASLQEDVNYKSKKGAIYLTEERIENGLHDDTTDLMSFSMEATISDSVNLSELLSYDSKDGRILSDSKEKQSEYSVYPVDSSLTTPESPTGDNVSEIPSSADSDKSNSISDLNKQMVISDSFILEVQNKHLGINANTEKQSHYSNGVDIYSNSSLKPENREIGSFLTGQMVEGTVNDKALISSLSPIASCSIDTMSPPLPVNSSFDENIILSPPENFNDGHSKSTATVQKQKDSKANKVRSEIKASAKSPTARSMERSMTEVHEICPKFVSGIAVSGSFAHELYRANSEFAESLHKKRSCSDKLSPISPIEESRRKFESEIGRLIVRDRQMKLEMEQIKAERQRHTQEKPSTANAEKSKTRGEKKFADILDFRKSPVKSLESDKKRLDTDDLLKSVKESMEEKKHSELTLFHGYSSFLRLENKPSVKELLSKFEGQKKEGDCSESPLKITSENVSSSPKHATSVFSNVQVINHNFPLTSSKTLNFSDVNQSPRDNQSSHVREHIFQTECVVRFPHPKPRPLKPDYADSYKNGSLSDYSFSDSGSNSWTSGQSDHRAKVTNSKTAFFSSDNLMNSSVQDSSMSFSHADKSPHKSSTQSDQSHLFTSPQSSYISDSGHHSSDQSATVESDSCERPFTSFKDTFDRAKKLTYQMKTEFFQRGLSQEKLQYESLPSSSTLDDSTACNETRSSRPVTESRKRQGPARQRPKSVPPPISRLSYVSEKTAADTISFPISRVQTFPKENVASHNVPKTEIVNFNGKESSNTSQTHEPPKRIRDRAAIFERSLSFSGCADKKSLSSSSHSPKAQSGSSAR